jgi:hypothetical protein
VDIGVIEHYVGETLREFDYPLSGTPRSLRITLRLARRAVEVRLRRRFRPRRSP